MKQIHKQRSRQRRTYDDESEVTEPTNERSKQATEHALETLERIDREIDHA